MKKKNRTSEEKKILKYELTHIQRVFLAMVGLVGLIMFWKGMIIYLDNPIVNNNPFLMIIMGIVIMFFTGRLISK